MGAYSNRNFGTFWGFWEDLEGQFGLEALKNIGKALRNSEKALKNIKKH